jgi:predicted metal-dependent HD superfamily phosphohydrolase
LAITVNSDTLKNRWLALFPSAVHATAASCFDELAAHYGEPHRHYHTLAHVSACLTLLDFVREELADPLAMELALWLHDVIYDPTQNDNEERSAYYAEALLGRLGVSPAVIATVVGLIRVTQHPAIPTSHDEALMVDIDLAILAAPAEAYRDYAAQIRQEYIHVPEALYREGRAAVLKGFLDQDSVYHSAFFHARFEARARANIEQERGRLIEE